MSKYLILPLLLVLSSGALCADAKNSTKPLSVDEELRLKPNDEEGNELKSLKVELLISKSDEKALQQLRRLLKKYQGTALEPSLHFRLAELYMRRAKTATFFEVHRDEASVIKFSPSETRSQASRSWISKAVDTYAHIEKKFAHFRDMDMVLFNDGFARQILGQEKQAVSLYKKVVDDYSESPLVPDCHLAIGESLFNAKQFQSSFEEFEKIRKFPEARVYPYGLYKGAWALYNTHQTPQALKQLEEVVAYSAQGTDESVNRLDLTREALDDMVLFYEDVKQPKEAVAYFRKQGGDLRVASLILKLGQIYQRHGRFNNLEIVYSDLIDAVPTIAERPLVHRDLINAYEMEKMRGKAATELETLSGLCSEKGKWAKVQKQEDRKVCWTQLEESGKQYASRWHRDYKKAPGTEAMGYARRAYEAVLREDHPISNEDKFRFSYAELLFQAADFRVASQQYSRVAHLTVDPKIRHDSSYGALVSLEKDVKDKWSDRDEREFARLAGDYLTLNPHGEFATDVKFKKAFIAYEKGRFDEASPQLKDLAIHFSSTERGRKAAQLYLDVLNIQKRFELLSDESLYFASKLSLDVKTKADFIKIHQQAAFTVVQSMESLGLYPEAIKRYMIFIKEDPHGPLADKALYNAIRCANLSGNLAEASRLSEQVISQYPESTYKLEITKALVLLYEAQAQLGSAGKTLLLLAEWEPQNRWANTLAAADYKALNNEWESAHQIYSSLVQKAPNSFEGKTALERIEALAEKNNQWDKAHRVLSQLVDMDAQPQASIANVKLAQKACDEKDEDLCFKIAKRTIAMRSEKKVSVWALAQARLLEGKILEHEFDRASVKARPERLSLVLKIKTAKLENVQKAYQDTIGYGDRVTAIEALTRMAKCYEKFSQALNSIDAPADSSEDDKKKFLKEIENLTVPIEEKNAETLQVALKQAKDMNLHDGTVAKIQAELNRLSRRALHGKVAFDLATPENVLPLVD